MKKICFIFVFSLFLRGFGQSLIPSTIGEVYKFEVGDVFEFSNTSMNFLGYVGCNMSGYHMRVVLDKWNSADTLHYKIQNSYAFHVYCSGAPQGSSSSGIDTITVSYSNLDSSIFLNHPLSFCDTFNQCHIDSSYIDSAFCNQKINRHLEGNYGWTYNYSEFADGLGNIRFVSFNEDLAYEQSTSTMIYYSKTTGQCGSFYPFTVNRVEGIKEDIIALSLSPNPAPSSFTLQLSSSPITETYLLLYDALGREVKRELITAQVSTLNRNHLPAGIYYWQLQSGGTPAGWGKLVME